MSSMPPDHKHVDSAGANWQGGLSLVNSKQWKDFQNPVLKLISLHSNSFAAQAKESLTIVEIPCPQQLHLDLAYRGTALQACVSVGQHLERGEPLTQKQLSANDNQILPAVLCPAAAVVESIGLTPCKQYARVSLSVSNDLSTNYDRLQPSSDKSFSKDETPTNSQPGALPWYCDNWKNYNREQRWKAVRDAAIRGHGGGGFLLADKASHSIRTLIINAVECEPLISCDAALIRHHAHEALLGIVSITELSHCHECIIAFESGDEWQIELLQQAIKELRQQYENSSYHKTIHNLCGRLSITTVPAVYPQGAERILVKTVTGKILNEHELPGDHGICCTNVATCHALSRLGQTGFPASERIVTLTGDAMYDSTWGAPINVQASFGTPITTLLNTAGLDSDNVRLQLGGPVCGKEIDSADCSVDATTNCIVISKTQATEQTDNCIRCGNCVDACPASLLPQQLHLVVTDNNQKLADSFNLSNCLECGCCDLVCPSNIPLTQQFRKAREFSSKDKLKADAANLALQRYENRKLRLEKREAARAEQRKMRKQTTDSKAQRKKEIAEALARARKKS